MVLIIALMIYLLYDDRMQKLIVVSYVLLDLEL